MDKLDTKKIATDYNPVQKASILQQNNIISVSKPETIKNLPVTKSVNTTTATPNITNLNSFENVVKTQNNEFEQAKKFLANKNINMAFSTDKDTGQTVIKFLDKNTNEVIKQIPTPEMINIAKSIDNFLKKTESKSSNISNPIGLILNERA
jgi:flagellar protein FlaG